ncbi:hypothetical protein K5D38_04535 [Pseudomonas cichorii]|nr:hypothetical protein [Pseudomonas cichorii]
MKMKKQSARSRHMREQQRKSLERYRMDFYRARYRAKVMSAVSMMVLMAGVSLYTKSLMPICLMTPIALTGVLMLTWFWRKRIGLVADHPTQPE